MNTKTIVVLGKVRVELTKDRAIERALMVAHHRESGEKVTKTHILYGFGNMFFEPVYVTDSELKDVAVAYHEFGTVYALHRGSNY